MFNAKVRLGFDFPMKFHFRTNMITVWLFDRFKYLIQLKTKPLTLYYLNGLVRIQQNCNKTTIKWIEYPSHHTHSSCRMSFAMTPRNPRRFRNLWSCWNMSSTKAKQTWGCFLVGQLVASLWIGFSSASLRKGCAKMHATIRTPARMSSGSFVVVYRNKINGVLFWCVICCC